MDASTGECYIYPEIIYTFLIYRPELFEQVLLFSHFSVHGRWTDVLFKKSVIHLLNWSRLCLQYYLHASSNESFCKTCVWNFFCSWLQFGYFLHWVCLKINRNIDTVINYFKILIMHILTVIYELNLPVSVIGHQTF